MAPIEPLGEPHLALAQQVEPHRVGAVLLDHLPRVDDVAPALRHLLALGIEHQFVHDHLLVDDGVERRDADREQRVEPAAGLVHTFADEVRWKVRLEVRLVLEGVVPLPVRHGARVEPGVDHLGDPPHHAAAVAARPAVLVDVGLVGIELRGQVRADPLRQLRIRADHFAVLPLRLTFPHVQRRAPVAVARQRPVDVVLEPLAEPPAPHFRRVPRHLGVHFEHTRLDRGGAHEPRAASVVDERRVAAPAERVLVLVGPRLEPSALVLQALDDEAVRLLVRDEAAVDLLPACSLERAVGPDRVHEGQAVLLGRGEVVRAERRGHVDEPRAFVGRYEAARHDDGPLALLRQLHQLQRSHVLLPHELAPAVSGDARTRGEWLAADVHVAGTRRRDDVKDAIQLVSPVLQVGMHGHRDVRQEGPGRRRPDDQLPPGIACERERHVYRVGLHFVVAEGQLVR